MPLVQEYIEALNRCLSEISARDVEEVAGLIFEAYRKGRHIFIMGNGGSATTASHLARDLRIGAAAANKPRILASSLSDNPAMVTAIANDQGYANIFVEQLIGQVSPGDIVIAISASGNSPNVLNAVAYSRGAGAITIGLTGFGGGKLNELVHKNIALTRCDYGQVEDIHLCLSHMLAYLLKDKLAGA